MSILRLLGGIFAFFGIIAGLAIVVISILLWWPSIFVVFFIIWWMIHTWKQERTKATFQILQNRAGVVNESVRKQNLKDGFNPDLPSALD